LDLTAGEHLLVSGANGSGKSTLLGVLSGRIGAGAGVVGVGAVGISGAVAVSGQVMVGARRVRELTQDPTFADLGRTVELTYRAAVGSTAPPLRELGLVHPRDLNRPVGLLSTGQRRRLALAIVLAEGPDLLLLDEPTNHLSLALAGELEEAFGHWAGGLIVASHDRWLRRRWAGAELRLGELG
ncbi:MAG: ATP-binding cassette domain-containing protein, partial [Nocardioides sp.]